jgi:16S rRNA C1402 (ribose-2'-O) methylase RsmI
VWRGSVRELAARAASTDVLGEIVLLLGPAPAPAEATDETLRAALREQMANGSSTRDATAFVASLFDVAHRHVYELALALRRESDE